MIGRFQGRRGGESANSSQALELFKRRIEPRTGKYRIRIVTLGMQMQMFTRGLVDAGVASPKCGKQKLNAANKSLSTRRRSALLLTVVVRQAYRALSGDHTIKSGIPNYPGIGYGTLRESVRYSAGWCTVFCDNVRYFAG